MVGMSVIVHAEGVLDLGAFFFFFASNAYSNRVHYTQKNPQKKQIGAKCKKRKRKKERKKTSK